MKVFKLRENAYVIENFETKECTLQSYDSTVAVIDRKSNKITLGKHWDYSVTTLKHVYQFLEEYALDLPRAFLESRTKKRSIETLIAQGYAFYDENLI